VRIGIDIGPIRQVRTGVGNYCHHLLTHLVDLAEGETFAAFSTGTRTPELAGSLAVLRHVHVPVPTRLMYALWGGLGLPRVDRLLGGVDVFHATNFFMPPTRTARRAVTIHDLTFLVHPELCSPRIVGPFSRHVRRCAREADAVLTYSESTRRDIAERLDVDAGRIHVAPLAADPAFAPMARGEARALLRSRHNLDGPFILFAGTLEPRKNVAALVRVFGALKDEIPHRLVLAGPTGWNTREAEEAIDRQNPAGRVVRPGFVPGEDLRALYSAADVFVFPSRYEGFGLPLLEAMACGCPVVAADNSAIPEVTGDAALLVNCADEAALAEAIMKAIGDAELRTGLIERGLRQAGRFSWRACAETTLAVYRSIV
jgi:glycosyltransferase involved in cell wall biosynthesis